MTICQGRARHDVEDVEHLAQHGPTHGDWRRRRIADVLGDAVTGPNSQGRTCSARAPHLGKQKGNQNSMQNWRGLDLGGEVAYT